MAKGRKVTSRQVAHEASKVVRNRGESETCRSVAGSALSQRERRRDTRRRGR
jgi:hypothetical protein